MPTGFARLGPAPDLFLSLVAGLPDAADLSASRWSGAFLFAGALSLLKFLQRFIKQFQCCLVSAFALKGLFLRCVPGGRGVSATAGILHSFGYASGVR